MPQLSDDELKALAQQQVVGGPQPGDVYEHYKGGIYSIVCRALREKDYVQVLTYHSNAHGTNWERTVEEFTEEVEVDGVRRPRFRQLLK